MLVQKRGDVSIYNLTAGPSLPEWISERARRNLSKKDEGVRRRIELLQDFGMPATSTKIRQSPDGRYFFATGTYPPRVRCYDTHELGMKFERYVTSGIVDICMLGQDYGKFCLLQDDRTLAFHAPYGAHESIRIPTFGRALAYESTTCELLVAAKGDSLYRVNLEEGRFQAPWQLQSDTSSSCLAVHPVHPLATVGCEDGFVRFWDSRNSSQLHPFVRLDASKAVHAIVDSYATTHSNEITAVANDDSVSSNGMHMAVGTATGLVAVYDIRSTRPMAIYPHRAGLPIHTLQFHNSGHGSDLLLLSGDEKLIQATSVKEAAEVTAEGSEWGSGGARVAKFHIEATSRFHHFCVATADENLTGSSVTPPSGLILCATDQPKMEAFYVPAIGVAPRWCSYLEGITEELHERDLSRDGSGGGGLEEWTGQETVYDSYQFVSRDDVEKLGIAHLIGTPLLRGYMHGFFMDANLHRRIRSVANPFEYEEYQKKKLKERIDAKRASRIAPKASSSSSEKGNAAAATAVVNPDLAERLEAKAALSSGKGAKDLLHDERFGSLFTNEDFEIDPENENFKLRNPSGVAALRRRKDNMDSDEDDDDDDVDDNMDSPRTGNQRFDQGESDDGSGGSSSDDDSDDDIGFKGVKVRGEEYEAMKALSRKPKKSHPVASSKMGLSSGKKRNIRMVEAEGGGGAGGGSTVGLGLGHLDATQKVRKRLEELQVPLGKRIAQRQQEETTSHRSVQVRVDGGSKEATYVPRDAKGKPNAGGANDDSHPRGKRNRRGVKDLGLKRLR